MSEMSLTAENLHGMHLACAGAKCFEWVKVHVVYNFQSPDGKERVGGRKSWVCFPGVQPVRVLCVRVRSCSREIFLLIFLEGKHLTVLWLLFLHAACGSLVAALILPGSVTAQVPV